MPGAFGPWLSVSKNYRHCIPGGMPCWGPPERLAPGGCLALRRLRGRPNPEFGKHKCDIGAPAPLCGPPWKRLSFSSCADHFIIGSPHALTCRWSALGRSSGSVSAVAIFTRAGMMRRVFVQLPSNGPSGGVKVANQLVNLFRDKGYDAYIVLPSGPRAADWLLKPAPVISQQEMVRLCQSQDLVVDNWPDLKSYSITASLPARTKIFYSQGCTYLRGRQYLGDSYFTARLCYTHYWFVSRDSLEYVASKYPSAMSPMPRDWAVVHPYLEFELAASVNTVVRGPGILAFSRKGPSHIRAIQIFGRLDRDIEVVDKFTEAESYTMYSTHRFFLHTPTGLSAVGRRLRNWLRLLKGADPDELFWVVSPEGRREGFSLPGAEAAMCGAVVVGFAMGGGREWMAEGNCFIAKDHSYQSLIANIREATSKPDDELNSVAARARLAVGRFTRENTWNQISESLRDEM